MWDTIVLKEYVDAVRQVLGTVEVHEQASHAGSRCQDMREAVAADMLHQLGFDLTGITSVVQKLTVVEGVCSGRGCKHVIRRKGAVGG